MGASSAAFTKKVLNSLPGLRCVSECGSGVGSIDIAAATDWGVALSNTKGAANTARERGCHRVAAGIAQAPQCVDAEVHAAWRLAPGHLWERDRRYDHRNQRIGRIGCGVADRLAEWDVPI